MSCDSDDSVDPITKIATIYIDESEVDNCFYTIKTENNEVFTTNNLPGEYSESTFESRIIYRVTEEICNCGFAGSLVKIEIVKLVEI
ncbi:hypothetical protein GCM10007103_30120 [Salinimicrobium marinum]|uniref:Uncharacterized protein n=1 Tax=Salinimicrobium marinum TaxID=680283 RepID=A0A918SIR2_9FLAO|nr:hypothetical protein GCM10007103_30120 [Salinimicrobium marinum]